MGTIRSTEADRKARLGAEADQRTDQVPAPDAVRAGLCTNFARNEV